MGIIRVEQLVKEFRTPKRQSGFLGGVRTLFTRDEVITRAVDGVTFALDAGELVGYIGPNGAGKSTTIKMLTGILVPTAGTVEVAGLVPWRERERNALNVGVVFGQRSQLWWDLPLGESFKLVAKMYRVPPATYQRNLDRFCAILGLDAFLATPVRQLSLGQRMRGDLTAAMLYEPRILYLDEPTVGLDVVAKEAIRGFIEETNRQSGTTIVLTTHDLADIERLCRRIIVIDHGRILFDGPVHALKARYAPHRVLVIRLDPNASVPEVTAEIPGAEFMKRDNFTISLRFDPQRVAVADLIAAATARFAVTDLSIVEPELEAVIRQIYGEGAVAQ